MTTDTNHTDAEATETSTAAPGWRLWILLVWHPALGLPVDPVAVLGLDESRQPAKAGGAAGSPSSTNRLTPGGSA